MPKLCGVRRITGVLAIVLAGCTQDATIRAGAEVRDSAGVRIVLNRDAGDVPLTVEEVLRIGAVEGEEPYMFSRIAAMAVDDEGNLYVANRQSGTIRVFTPEGRFLREFGRKGYGPGEFHGFISIDVVGDTVAIFGSGRDLKAVLFSRAGRLLGDWGLVRSNGLTLAPLAFRRTGWIGTVNDQMLWPRRFPPGAQVQLSRDVVEIVPERDSASEPWLRLPPAVFRANRKGETKFDLFRVYTWMAADSNGTIYVPVEGEYRVNVYERDGRHAMTILREHDPVPLTERDVEAMLAFNDARWDTATLLLGLDRPTRRRLGAEDIRERAEAMPRHLAPVRRILAIPAGGFWIERIDHRPAAEIEIEGRTVGGSPFRLDRDTRWDVFGPDGLFRYTVELPPRFSPLLVTDASVAGVFWDDLDVEYVVGYRVRER